MKILYVTDDEKVFSDRVAAEEHEDALHEVIAVPVPVLQEALRQATPYMISAKQRRELGQKLENLLKQPPLEWDAEAREKIWDELQSLAPWNPSNDMPWEHEILCGIVGVKERIAQLEKKQAGEAPHRQPPGAVTA